MTSKILLIFHFFGHKKKSERRTTCGVLKSALVIQTEDEGKRERKK